MARFPFWEAGYFILKTGNHEKHSRVSGEYLAATAYSEARRGVLFAFIAGGGVRLSISDLHLSADGFFRGIISFA